MRIARLLITAATLGLAGAASAASLDLRFIGQQVLPTATFYQGTQVGGLSGIDYIGGGQYIAISDDRSQINNARYYGIDLALTSSAFTGVSFTGVTTLLDPAGNPYATFSIDPEAIRRLPNGNYAYTSEGDVNRNINAFVREMTPGGVYVRDYAIPATLQQTGPGGTTGVRNNLAFESLTVAGGNLLTGTENAPVQDGPAAGFGIGSPSRLLAFDGTNAGAEFVYNVGPVLNATVPPGQFSTNGLVELLSLGGTKYLALERSFVTGYTTPWSTTGNSIQIYEIDTAGATDVSGLASLAGATYTPVSKSLLLDLDSLRIPLDNIEGFTFGETLENGKRSLVLVSDNNFSGTQFTQFLAFEVTPVPEPGTWALLVAGFGLTGAAMRRRVRGVVAA